MLLNETLKLVTHNGTFHADDLFAAATLTILLENKGKKFEIIRNRDADVVQGGDFVFDVGGIYDPAQNRFDHHQKGGAGTRQNGIEYASFGLVWKTYGALICGSEEVAYYIDNKIVSPIDAIDNGIQIVTAIFDEVIPYNASETFSIFMPTWEEDESKLDDVFREEVQRAARVLRRTIEVVNSDLKGRKMIIEAYENSKDKRVVELPNSFPRYLYQDTLARFPEPLYAVYFSKNSRDWGVEAIQTAPGTFLSRKPFPPEWRGIMNHDPRLPEITGVPDIIFCHRSGYLLHVKSKEGAEALIEKSLLN